ncbi:hypothetical protein Tco_0032409 [Tanacetum coccineum]
MEIDRGKWGTAVKTSAGCSWQSNMPYMHWGSKNNDNPHTNKDLGIVDSGCSRSMTGNKEKLADFVKIKGGTVTFRGGDGKIIRKGTIRTSNFNFENFYLYGRLQNFNCSLCQQICDNQDKVLFIDKDTCVLLSNPRSSNYLTQVVVLKSPRRHNSQLLQLI